MSTEADQSKRRLGVAVFGIGRAGQIHCGNVLANPRLNLQWIIEEDLSLAQKYMVDQKVTTTKVIKAAEMKLAVEDPNVDFVIVATPTKTHSAIVTSSLRAKKAVFCEKPVANSVEETHACYDEAEKARKPLFCAFQRRFDPSMGSIRQRILDGSIGKVHMIKTCSRDGQMPGPEYVRTSGGIFHDSTVHDIDMVCWLAGEAPSTVYATGHAFIPYIKEAGDVDTVAVTLKFPSGVIGIIDQSRHAVYGYDQRLEVFGEKGMLVTENVRPTTTIHLDGSGIHGDRVEDFFPTRYREAYKRELDHFADVVEGKAELLHQRKDAILTMQVAAACAESNHQGQVIPFLS